MFPLSPPRAERVHSAGALFDEMQWRYRQELETVLDPRVFQPPPEWTHEDYAYHVRDSQVFSHRPI